ncbi:Hypothetical protein A7982_03540 [Minicystis rosea]|nr:Hypothetical protein A7982_03540 [Minicystis rosea]
MEDHMRNNGFTSKSLSQLFKAAEDEGTISPKARAVLDVPDLGAQIQAGLGVNVDDVESSEVVLVTIMPDDSGSIRFAGNAGAVREGHNLVLDALVASKQKDSILSHTRYLNGKVLHPYCLVAQAERMTSANYDPTLGTPLYDQAVVLLGTVLAKAQEFAAAGVPVRTVTLLITDGADEHSLRAKAADVAAVVRDMAMAESHIIAAMGISDGHTDFREVFRTMGIEDRWVLTPSHDASEIRRAFLVFSQSAVRASQGGGAFSRAAAGGFAAP